MRDDLIRWAMVSRTWRYVAIVDVCLKVAYLPGHVEKESLRAFELEHFVIWNVILKRTRYGCGYWWLDQRERACTLAHRPTASCRGRSNKNKNKRRLTIVTIMIISVQLECVSIYLSIKNIWRTPPVTKCRAIVSWDFDKICCHLYRESSREQISLPLLLSLLSWKHLHLKKRARICANCNARIARLRDWHFHDPVSLFGERTRTSVARGSRSKRNLAPGLVPSFSPASVKQAGVKTPRWRALSIDRWWTIFKFAISISWIANLLASESTNLTTNRLVGWSDIDDIDDIESTESIDGIALAFPIVFLILEPSDLS